MILFSEKSNLKACRINVNLIRRQTEVDRRLFYMRKQVENKVCSRGISFFGKIIFDNSSLTCFNFILRFKQIHLYLANFQIRLSQQRVSQRNFFTFDLRLILNHRISQISFLPGAITHHPMYIQGVSWYVNLAPRVDRMHKSEKRKFIRTCLLSYLVS